MTLEKERRATRRNIVLALKIALFLGALLFLNYVVGWLANFVAFQMWPRHVHMALFLLGTSVAAYVLLLAVPFLPGIEVGIMIMMLLDRPGIALVYLCTVLALSLSFLFGRLLPARVIGNILAWFHHHRAPGTWS